ncbi:aminotransferase class I/II-fold pyridoxal phosphate-dependent enzyme [Bizionia gelidisalsuginis]|uniref:Aminotransferase n=1 Tax=Bizionia gelidisalsuginis TaxID=291188 RepID=A0ABY3MAE6_9FLAO|nr:aminotransferase class I/II-fold pyridoxal phosphate-dependent enzyme [Bizionia gelidisalsuginis]TYC12698.1 aminotransferase class I/II-fold pyridoxal phosphate-dependent enzyme [Bizionia gelidisalsuginis]
MEVANRLNTIEEYYFSTKLKEVIALQASGKPIINLGIGSPDLEPPKEVVSALVSSLYDKTANTYQSYQGLPELRNGIRDFYHNHFKVSVNPETEVLPLMGSKEGVLHISLAFLNKGDAVLIPNPGYPTYFSVTKLVEAEAVFYELEAANNWFPDLEALEERDLSKVKLMWVNYPNMPTGARASKQQLKALVAFAKKHNILLVNDNPYSLILNDEPLSLLAVDGAKNVCLELNSLSKTFNLAGWRVGMVLGAEEHINAILNVKSNMDSGMFYGIQKGAIKALEVQDDWFATLNTEYEKRREAVWELAERLGCTFNKKASGLFVWAKLPEGLDSESFINELLIKKDVFIAPGFIFGSQGDGYIRLSLCAPLEDIQTAIQRL